LATEVSQLRAAVLAAKKELATLQAAKDAAKDTAKKELLAEKNASKKNCWRR
jgi:hypothetical protein